MVEYRRTWEKSFKCPTCSRCDYIVKSLHLTCFTGYTISFYGTTGTFHNRSVEQTAAATSSSHAEARAIFTVAKELNFLIALCQELQNTLWSPAIIMEDNSAVVTMTNNDSGYTLKCTFWWSLTTSKSRSASAKSRRGRSIGKLNNEDMHAKPLRSSDFAKMAHKILNQPAPLSASTPNSPPSLPAESMSMMSDLDVDSQPSNERKRLRYQYIWLCQTVKGASRSICDSSRLGFDAGRCSRYPLRHYVWWVLGCLLPPTVTATFITVKMMPVGPSLLTLIVEWGDFHSSAV